MHVLKVRNVHEALPEAIRLIKRIGIPSTSRNGPVLVAPEPVTTVYSNPVERVMFWPERDANPFFHFFESLWMLSGHNDVKWLSVFNSNIGRYSDNRETFHGAYGYRWRSHFGFDQIPFIIHRLKVDPFDRRQVLQIWDATSDMTSQEGMKDLPCNLMVHFQINPATMALDMTVFNRSNDIIWGCYGANAVHFSYLQEYIAHRVGAEVGVYRQISDNWHAYIEVLEPLEEMSDKALDPVNFITAPYSPYDAEVSHYPMFSPGKEEDSWDQDLSMFMSQGAEAVGFRHGFFKHVAAPMIQAWYNFKFMQGEARYKTALRECERIRAGDWRLACSEFIQRRYDKFMKAQDDGPDYEGVS